MSQIDIQSHNSPVKDATLPFIASVKLPAL